MLDDTVLSPLSRWSLSLSSDNKKTTARPKNEFEYIKSSDNLDMSLDSLKNEFAKKSRRTLLKLSKKKSFIYTAFIVASIVVLNINSTSDALENIRRILCLADEGGNGHAAAVTPHIAVTQVQRGALSQGPADAPAVDDIARQMNPPQIPGRRPIPSHIELCQAFLQRREMTLSGSPLPLDGHVHVIEDEAVCKDWSTPLSSLFEIFAGEIINQVSQKYGVTYSHDCQKVHHQGTGDHLDWTTIQQEFPASGLVLDDGTVSEHEVVELCKGCVSGFNTEQATSSVNTNNPNPSWFNPHSTRHCIVYPGTSKPLVNSENEHDMAAIQQQRLRAQSAPFGKMFRTVQDRMRLAAAKHKLEHAPTAYSSTGSDAVAIEEQDGAIIYIDEGSMAMPMIQVTKNIPPSAKTITILINPLCVSATWENGERCYEYAHSVLNYVKDMNPNADASLEVTTSTATATSRMIRARTLLCTPGSVNCLLPAMSKEENTFAVVGESSARSNTEQFFDFFSTSDYQLQVSDIDKAIDIGTITRTSGTPEAMSETELEAGISAFTSDPRNSDMKVVDGCVELRGRIGDWEQEFVYEDLATERNSLLRGSSAEDIQSGMEEGRQSRNEDNKIGAVRAWSEGEPECGLDMLNIHGLCEVVNSMQLGVIQFVGDKYTEEQVKSFWALLGLPDADDSGKDTPSTTGPEKYRKTVHCPLEKISFDIVFTPNENLVQDIVDIEPIKDDFNKRQRYVPAPAPIQAPVQVPVLAPVELGRGGIPGPGVSTGTGFVGNGYAGNGYAGWGYGRGGGSCWTDPYSAGCGCDPSTMVRTMTPPPPPPPQMNPSCQCIPFQQQYDYNYAMALQPYQQQPIPNQAQSVSRAGLPAMPATGFPYQSGRQFVVGGVTPNQPYQSYVDNIDQFGQTVTNTVDANDIVVLRTGVVVPEAYGGQRRTKRSTFMTQEEVEEANDHLHKSVDEYRRKARQSDFLSYDPVKSRLPYVHVLDVTHMTHSHPLAHAGAKGHRDLSKVPNLYDHWNHMLYTNMRDIAKAELARKSSEHLRRTQESAPPGSPYHNSIPLFP